MRRASRTSASASCGTASGPTSNESHGRTSSGTAVASVRATSPSPEWLATTGRAPQAAASAATIPNASGNVLVTAIASAAGSRSASSSWSSRPANATRSSRRRIVGVLEERGELRELAPVLPARLAAAPPRRPAASCAASRSSPGRNAPNPTTISRARGSRASTSGQAASSSSTPLDAISLPTNTTSRSPASIVSSADDRLAHVAVERGAGGGDRRRARPAARAARRRRPARHPARAARTAPTSTPGGPSRVRPGSDGSSISAHSDSAVWREPTSTPRAPARPSTAYGRNRGYGLTTYSSALPWIFTAYGTSPSARARIAGPITRWFASATSGRARSTTSRTAATLASR